MQESSSEHDSQAQHELLLEPTNRHFESHALLWTISRAKRQVCRINCHACSSSPVGWDPRSLSGVMHWEERVSSCFADVAFAFEQQPAERFPFMLAMAYPHSALLKTMVSVNAKMGAERDSTLFISSSITQDPRVMDCLIFFIYTGLLVDVNTLTKGGVLSICAVLTHEAVVNAEFAFDMLVQRHPCPA